eukprot:359944-Chlamydomonas_euryale.AAC.6
MLHAIRARLTGSGPDPGMLVLGAAGGQGVDSHEGRRHKQALACLPSKAMHAPCMLTMCVDGESGLGGAGGS